MTPQTNIETIEMPNASEILVLDCIIFTVIMIVKAASNDILEYFLFIYLLFPATGGYTHVFRLTIKKATSWAIVLQVIVSKRTRGPTACRNSSVTELSQFLSPSRRSLCHPKNNLAIM